MILYRVEYKPVSADKGVVEYINDMVTNKDKTIICKPKRITNHLYILTTIK